MMLLSCFIAAGAAGCVAGRFVKLQAGMTKVDVLTVLGKPDRTKFRNGVESWYYELSEFDTRVLLFDADGQLFEWE